MPLGALALCMVLYGAGGAPGALENTIGAPGSMPIGAQVPGRKLGPGTSRGAAALVLCARSGTLNVEPRGGVCAHVDNVAHCDVTSTCP